VEAVIKEDAIFASNTSSLPITEIAGASTRPEQIIGMHYFSPVPKMPLLEIILTAKTAPWVTATALDVGIRQGKTVIVVKDGPGFYTTRILAPFLYEALLLLNEGGGIQEIDRAMCRFGYPVGPITLLDEVGIDVGAHVSKVLGPFFSQRGIQPNEVMETLFKAGYTGRKNNKGFYRYDPPAGKKKKEVNEEVYSFFGGPKRVNIEDAEIQNRLSLVMTNEAAYCLEEGILNSPHDGDIGAVFGLGFPPFLEGLSATSIGSALKRSFRCWRILRRSTAAGLGPARSFVIWLRRTAGFTRSEKTYSQFPQRPVTRHSPGTANL